MGTVKRGDLQFIDKSSLVFPGLKFNSNMTTKDSLSDSILASSINPFDKSYSSVQRAFDRATIDLLLEILNLNLTLITTPLLTNITAYTRDPDIWLLEQIANGSAEISSSTLVLTSDTPKVCDFSYGLQVFRPQLYYKARSLREDKNIYSAPFSSEVWIFFIFVFLLLFFALIFILNREAKIPHKVSYHLVAQIKDLQEDRDEVWTEDLQKLTEATLQQREKWELGEILLVCIGAICQQGSARDPSTNAARTLLLVLFMLAIVIYTAYSASIISLISLFPSTTKEQNLIVQNSVKRFTDLLYDNDKILKYLQLNFTNYEHSNLENGISKALKGKAAFLGDRDVVLTFLQNHNYNTESRCTLARVFLGIEYHKVLAIKVNSTFKKKINSNIIRLKEFGLLEREKKRIFNVKPPCTFTEKSSYSNFVKFDKNDVAPALMLFQIGCVTSVLLLVIENCIFYFK